MQVFFLLIPEFCRKLPKKLLVGLGYTLAFVYFGWLVFEAICGFFSPI
jgi:hypothetical protein